MYALCIMEAKNKSDSDSDLQILLQIHELPVNVLKYEQNERRIRTESSYVSVCIFNVEHNWAFIGFTADSLLYCSWFSFSPFFLKILQSLLKGAMHKINSPLVVVIQYQLYSKINLCVSHTSPFQWHSPPPFAVTVPCLLWEEFQTFATQKPFVTENYETLNKRNIPVWWITTLATQQGLFFCDY